VILLFYLCMVQFYLNFVNIGQSSRSLADSSNGLTPAEMVRTNQKRSGRLVTLGAIDHLDG